MGFGEAKEYQLVHLKKGATLNIREVPIVNSSTVVGKIPANATGIIIKHCKYNENGQEWCYVNYPLGGYHLEGWVNRHYLTPMKKNAASKLYITNFLYNFYMADEENFLDKLQSFYTFPMQQYMYVKDLSLMELRSNKVNFYKKWPKRDYQLTHLKILKRKEKYVDVQATVRWKIQHGELDEAGKDIQKLRLIPNGNSFKVLAIKNLRHTVFPKVVDIVDENQTQLSDEQETNTPVKEVLSGLKYYIKVGSFFGKINTGYLAKIKNNRFSYIVQKVKQGDKVIRRVFIGPYSSSEEASSDLSKVRSLINHDAYIQKSIR